MCVCMSMCACVVFVVASFPFLCFPRAPSLLPSVSVAPSPWRASRRSPSQKREARVQWAVEAPTPQSRAKGFPPVLSSSPAFAAASCFGRALPPTVSHASSTGSGEPASDTGERQTVGGATRCTHPPYPIITATAATTTTTTITTTPTTHTHTTPYHTTPQDLDSALFHMPPRPFPPPPSLRPPTRLQEKKFLPPPHMLC